jgi:predicted TIM-barrel fold metal-dependent hydrolase
MVRFTSDNGLAPLQLAFAGVFGRFPQLRVYWAETQIGWLPYCLSQIDDNYERDRHWAYRQWGLEPLKRKPSEYLRECNLWGFMRDPFGVRLRHEIGVEKVLWGSDFAHAAGDWPHSRKTVEETFVGVPEGERYAMLAGNAIEFFGLKEAVPELKDIKSAQSAA